MTREGAFAPVMLRMKLPIQEPREICVVADRRAFKDSDLCGFPRTFLPAVRPARARAPRFAASKRVLQSDLDRIE